MRIYLCKHSLCWLLSLTLWKTEELSIFTGSSIIFDVLFLKLLTVNKFSLGFQWAKWYPSKNETSFLFSFERNSSDKRSSSFSFNSSSSISQTAIDDSSVCRKKQMVCLVDMQKFPPMIDRNLVDVHLFDKLQLFESIDLNCFSYDAQVKHAVSIHRRTRWNKSFFGQHVKVLVQNIQIACFLQVN